MSNEDNARRFGAEIKAFQEEALRERVRQFQVGVGFEALSRIVLGSPVLDAQFRASWQVGTTPQGGSGGPVDATGDATIELGRAALDAIPAYRSTFIATNMPQALVIEEGKYPVPVKRGTRIRQAYLRARRARNVKRGNLPPGTDPNYEIRSEGGFSKQAPEGVVAPVVIALQDYFERD